MKKLSILIVLIMVLIGCKPTRIFLNSPIPEQIPPIDYHTSVSNYKPIELANGCVKIVDVSTYYDEAKYLNTEFQLTDENGRYYYFGGTNESNKKIWCYLSDSVNGVNNVIKNFVVTEGVQRTYTTNAIGFVLDHSGSMGEERAKILQNAANEQILQKAKDDGFFFLKFDVKSNVEVPLSVNKDFLKNNFKKNGLQNYGGGTALNNSIDLGITNLEVLNNFDTKSIFLFTDGQDNSSSISKETVVNRAKSKNIKIFVIGFGEYVDDEYLKFIAINTGGNYYHIYQSVEFAGVFDDIYSKLLVQPLKYKIAFKPKSYFGQHYLKIKVCMEECAFEAVIDPFEANIKNNDTILLDVKFRFDKTIIEEESYDEIALMADYLKRHPEVKIRLEGHTDCRGDKNTNLKLSEDRALAVKNALILKGINKDRIEIKGFGSEIPNIVNSFENKLYGFLPVGAALTCDFISKLESSDKKEIAHSLNRRTEMIVIK